MADSPRRAPRSLLFGPVILALLIMAGYGAFWIYASGVMKDEIAEFVADEEAKGHAVTYEDVEIRGFPFVLRAEFENFRWSAPGMWDWTGERLDIVTIPYNPERLIFVPRDGQRVTWQGETFDVRSDGLRVGVEQGKYSAEGTNVVAAGPRVEVQLGGFAANWIEQEDRAGWILGMSVTQGVFEDSNRREVRLPYWNLAASSVERGTGDVMVDATEMAITSEDVSAPTILKLSGPVGIDTDGYPEGRISLSLRNPRALLAILGTFEALGPTELQQAEAAITALAAGGTSEVTLPVIMRDAELYIGPVRIGALPQIR
jgi:hypothetical protein